MFSALHLDYFEIYGFGIVEGKGNAEQRGSWEWERISDQFHKNKTLVSEPYQRRKKIKGA